MSFNNRNARGFFPTGGHPGISRSETPNQDECRYPRGYASRSRSPVYPIDDTEYAPRHQTMRPSFSDFDQMQIGQPSGFASTRDTTGMIPNSLEDVRNASIQLDRLESEERAMRYRSDDRLHPPNAENVPRVPMRATPLDYMHNRWPGLFDVDEWGPKFDIFPSEICDTLEYGSYRGKDPNNRFKGKLKWDKLGLTKYTAPSWCFETIWTRSRCPYQGERSPSYCEYPHRPPTNDQYALIERSIIATGKDRESAQNVVSWMRMCYERGGRPTPPSPRQWNELCERTADAILDARFEASRRCSGRGGQSGHVRGGLRRPSPSVGPQGRPQFGRRSRSVAQDARSISGRSAGCSSASGINVRTGITKPDFIAFKDEPRDANAPDAWVLVPKSSGLMHGGGQVRVKRERGDGSVDETDANGRSVNMHFHKKARRR